MSLEAPSPAVSLSGVTKTFEDGVKAVDDVSLTLERGSYTAVMGMSGSGKSTLLDLVGCLRTPTRGTITLDGDDVSDRDDDDRSELRGSKVGFVFQSFQLMPRLTARENVALPLVFRGRPEDERRARADELLTRVGLEDRADARPGDLSGGQRQRVAIARALAPDPAVLLADEPTGSLDTATGERILSLFDDLNAEGCTVLLVTHSPAVASHADRVVRVQDGTVVERDADVDGSLRW